MDEGSRRRRTRRLLGVGAAVALTTAVAVALGLPVLTSDPAAPEVDDPRAGERPNPAVPSPTPDLEAEPFGEEEGWFETVFARGVSFRAVASHDGTYVAVADTSVAQLFGDEEAAAGSVPIWWSTDGRGWTRVADGAGPMAYGVWTVVATQSGFAALVADPRGGSTAWLSDDGRSWHRSDAEPEGFRPYGLVETDLGLVAWGRGHVWISRDGGRAWEAASGDRQWPAVDATLNPCWVEQTRGGLRALVIRERASDVAAVHWRSADGLSWEQGGVVEARNPEAVCFERDGDGAEATSPLGTVAIAPDDEAYDSSIFFGPAS